MLVLALAVFSGSNLFQPSPAQAMAPTVPRVTIEYSYALDMYCPSDTVPESLLPWQKALIPRIPEYRKELLLNGKLDWIQQQWDLQGAPLVGAAAAEVGRPFPMRDLQASVFLCPRFPFMGTPLSFNVISYLESSARDMPPLGGKPLPIFLFISTAVHEVLHKYVDAILKTTGSEVLRRHAGETDLYRAHLHLFALQKRAFEILNLRHLLPAVGNLEAGHGPDYVRAWKAVHENEAFERELLAELKTR